MGLPYHDLFKPVSDTEPSGPDLRKFPRHMELMRLAQGVPSRTEVVEAPTPDAPAKTRVIEAQEPEWSLVRDMCIELFGQTHDLEVAAWYTVALLRLNGYAGLAEGLGAVRWLLEKEWDTVHPAIDAEDVNNPGWRRSKILNQLSAPAGSKDPFKLVRRIREAELARSRNLGGVSLRKMARAAGQEPPDPGDEDKRDLAALQAVFVEAEPDELHRTRQDVEAAIEHVSAIDRVFTGNREENVPGRVKPGQEPNLSRLKESLQDALRHLAAALARPVAASGEAIAQSAGVVAGSTGWSVGAPGVASRADARAALDAVVKYYLANERSSPVWLLAQAARQLIERRVDELFAVLDQPFVEKVKSLGEDKPSPGASGS